MSAKPRSAGDQIVQDVIHSDDWMVISLDYCSSSPEMPSVTVGIAIVQLNDGFFSDGELNRWRLILRGTYDAQLGWVDDPGDPEIGSTLRLIIDDTVSCLWDVWAGHVVDLQWELDASVRAAVEQLNVSLPSHVHLTNEFAYDCIRETER
ncbi:hypothetical protein OHB26_05825 [Nocardia sp. NBC_01503]|uniref:hypothetical protein n=1 Tax=Nocardia sp. NBC_01503 TaxID=2975997 RepID=UPI002E7B8CB7|nr:hypothetical protein [Nocardia sp. NBC_01503]WTL33742.1 hypothetical protein OHB26_05825 [Nocardia sp. NBC_01503]